MGATVTVIKDPFFELDGVDYSDQVKELSLPFSIDEIEATASGDTSHVNVPGLEKFSMEAKVFRTAAIDTAIWGMKGTTVTCKFRRSQAAKAADNPEYSATVFVANYPPISGAVGAGDEVSIQMSAASALSRDTGAK